MDRHAHASGGSIKEEGHVSASGSAPGTSSRAHQDFEGAAVSLSNICKSYGRVRAVDDVSLEVSGGEFIALLGPSGSGKTTLFMTIAGFEQSESGRIVVGGNDVTRAPAYDRGFGMVFQRYALFPHMGVADNIAYPLKMRRVPANKRRQLVNDALDMVDMGGMGSRKPDQISGGQQQRVALARALVYRPPVLLMDEPLAALDRKLREQVQLEIRRLHKELGTTVLYVTHDQEEAMVMADRVCVMRDGKLLQVGPPTELYDEPADSFVAGFLGRTNLFTAELLRVESQRADVRLGGHAFTASLPPQSPLAGESGARSTVQVAIRPEQVTVTKDRAGIPGRIAEIIFTGATTSVRVDMGFAVIDAIMVTNSSSRSLREGDEVSVSWPENLAKVYPHDSGSTKN